MKITPNQKQILQDPRRKNQLQRLVQKLGLPKDAPIDWFLLNLALTHPSLSGEANYQQLEFIGDAVVRLAASELLWEVYPDASVGEFSAIRKVLVSDRTLAAFAQSLGVEPYLLVGGSAVNNETGRMSRLADAFEAILAALYLSSQSMELVRPWLDPLLQDLATEIRKDPARQNYKDALQEWTQAQYKILPEYRVTENEHHRVDGERFVAEVWLREELLGKGTGSSKKAAEKAAAKEAFVSFVLNSGS
ncbi:MAG: ribonuclease III [Spirulinaceae cyanobacterium]